MRRDDAIPHSQELASAIYLSSYITRGEDEKPFTLRSGATSREYFDKYLFESDSRLLYSLANYMSSVVDAADTDGIARFDMVAGLEMGGIAIATMLSWVTGLTLLQVRKQPKEHGTAKAIEGPPATDRAVLLVEDVVTSGGQVINSANDLRIEGARVSEVVCAIDRSGTAGMGEMPTMSVAEEKLAEYGLKLHAAFTMEELKAAAM